MSAGFLFGNSAALAAAPPANTVIGNQASANYIDPNGLAQTATSNLVQTTVQQVGAYTLDGSAFAGPVAVNTKTGAAGATVYAPHVLVNTGNGADSFSISVAPADNTAFTSIAIYADANGDGLPDNTTPICTASATGCTTTAAQTVAGNNGQFQFVVAYSIPSTALAASAPWTTSQLGTVTAAPVASAVSYTVSSIAVTDTVNLTIDSAFNMTKAIGQPAAGVLAPGGLAWPAAPGTGQRSDPLVACAVDTYANALADSTKTGCQYTVYTLTMGNTGGADGAFSFSDTLPDGFTYVPGSAVWSGASGVALTGLTTGATLVVDGANAQKLDGTITSLGRNQTQTISFVVRVDSDATVGTGNTTNFATFTETAGGGLTGKTNNAAFTVQATRDIVLGSLTGTTTRSPVGTAIDASAGVPQAGAGDTTTVASATAGSAVPFSVLVSNTGDAGDSVNLAVVSGDTFPAGTTFSFFKADGFTPLPGNNTEVIPAGGSATIVVKANLPSTLAPTTGQTYTLIVTGTSVGDGTQVESTRLVLQGVTGVLVDLTNTASSTGNDVGTGPSTSPTTTNTGVQVGTTTSFNLFVTNNDVADRTYNLLAGSTPSMGAMPAGWTVTFGSDAACASPITTLTVTASTADAPYFACVSVPATQPAPFTQPVYFQVRSAATATLALAVDTKYDAVAVVSAATFGATLTPNNIGQVAPGGSVVYAHTLNATGTNSCTGGYTLTVTGLDAGWTYALYVDVNGDGQLDAADTLVTAAITDDLDPALAAPKYLVKVFAPGGASAGTVNTATVTVTFAASLCNNPSATDTTTVITGQIRLVKTQALVADCTTASADGATFSAAPITAAKPGECIVYRVVATNEGAAPVSNMTVHDAVPAWTALAPAQPTTRCTSLGVTPAAAFTSTASTVSCGGTANTVQPGGTATLTFSVRIQN